MSGSRMSRLFVALAALLFAAIAAALWLFPREAAERLGLAITGREGLVALTADIGGLFASLALLTFTALRGRRDSAFLAVAIVLGAIATGRLVGWLSTGSMAGGVLPLVVELSVMAAMLGIATPAHREARVGAGRRGALLVGAGLLLALLGAVTVMSSATMMQRIYDAGARKVAATVNSAPLDDDALRVAVCGSSAPLPSAKRAKACVAVFAGGKYYVVDAGPESTENLVLWGIPLRAVGGVLLTHFHSDHIGGLGELSLQTWAGGRPEPLAVYGPPGVEGVVAGFNDAYRLDQGYRTAHHGEQVMPSKTWPMVPHVVELDGPPTPALSRTAVVLDDGALRITAIEVNHAPVAPAYAYRFDYKGRSVVITGDLKDHPPLVEAARDADVLVSEAIAVNMTRSLGTSATGAGLTNTAAIMHDIEDYHITPEQAASIANRAGVKLLVYYHLLPAPDGALPRRLFAAGVNDVRPSGWTIADDGSMYTLPLDSKEVQIGRVVP